MLHLEEEGEARQVPSTVFMLVFISWQKKGATLESKLWDVEVDVEARALWNSVGLLEGGARREEQ